METVMTFVFLFLIMTIAIVTIFSSLSFISKYIRRRKVSVTKAAESNNGNFEFSNLNENQVIISIKELPTSADLKNMQLSLIKDNGVIARISETFPSISNTIAKNVTNSELNNRQIFEAIIPMGAELVKSKGMDSAFRGFIRGSKISGHANLQKVTSQNLSKASTAANGVANVMNVGSLIVGQYYMNEINSKLENISKDVNKISDFQDREFKGRILALISGVRKISNFSTEILENDELRKIKLQTLDSFETECEKLLQNVNLAIDSLIKSKSKIDFSDYKKTVNVIWIQKQYQQTLLAILSEICQLNYCLYKGNTSMAYCISTYKKSHDQSLQLMTTLAQWHHLQLSSLKIDVQNERVRKKGFNLLISEIPATFDENWRFNKIEQDLKAKIESQIELSIEVNISETDVYEKDVKIIIKDGDLYFVNEDINE